MGETRNVEGYKFAFKQRVRYQHVDVQGIVYHARYIDFLEGGRMEYFRNIGITSKNMIEKGYDFVNVEIHCYYKKPAHLDEVILINTKLSWIRNSSFCFEYVLQEQKSGNILVTANSLHVMVDSHTYRPRRIPDQYRELFRQFEGDTLTEYGLNAL
ncbi:tol-pal system-associated acyl-CoA thioesterase [Paradesulfitobacterium aromaticivorans]